MKAEVEPAAKIDRLEENLRKRVKEVRRKGSRLIVETESIEKLEKTPGIKSFTVNGEKHEGLGGEPVDEQVYARIETKEDAVKALIATLEGYNLVVLNTERQWDLRRLREYNPDIKHLKQDQPEEFLGIEKTISDIEGLEKVDIGLEEEDDIPLIYQEMLT